MAPLATTAIALMLFGVLHNVLELRYVGGRFAEVLSGTFLTLMVALITGIVGCRLLGAVLGGEWPLRTEIVISYAIVAAAAWFGLRRHLPAFLAVCAVLAVAATTSLSWPAYHVVVITHLHNLIPLAFLWEFSAGLAPAGRRVFRSVQVGWLVVVPGLVLTGLADRWLAGGSGTHPFGADPAAVAVGITPPGEWATPTGQRFLTVFAFLQLMHFLVWVWFLPRYAPVAARAFDARVPWLRGRRIWWLGIGAGAFLAMLFLTDYGQGRALYAAVASYHAYLELPLLIAAFLGFVPTAVSARPAGTSSPGRPAPPSAR